MAIKSYPVTHVKIGNQNGFCLPRAFFKDYPHLANVSGYMEVLSDNTFLLRLETDNIDEADEDEGIIMSLFLYFLMKDAMQNHSKLVPYTQEMSDEMDDLLADVVID